MSGLIEKIRNKTAVMGVVGIGYVGLPLAVEKAKSGYKTIGYDVLADRVEMINHGVNYIGDVVDSDLADLVNSGMLRATTEFRSVANTDCICICVPTPLDDHQVPYLNYIRDSAKQISKYLHKDMLIVLESTTYPGTTEELLKPILEDSGLVCGEDFYLAFSPERVDPGNKIYKTKNTPKVVGGCTPQCTAIAAEMYRSILNTDVHMVSSPTVAEMEKILENMYRNINVGLINELAILCNKMGINIWEVIEAAKSKPYGFQAFYPGPGLGGHCIPLDPYYLSWKAREYGFHTSMIESSMMINDRMPAYCVERAMLILNRARKAINGAKVLVLGVAYKQDINDYRESPAIRVIAELRKVGAVASYFDPWVREFQYANGETEKSIPDLSPEIVAGYDLVIITCAHTNVDYQMVQKNAQAIFDTKNAMKDIVPRDNIEVL